MIGCHHPCHDWCTPGADLPFAFVGAVHVIGPVRLSMSLKTNRAWSVHVRTARVACLAVQIHVRFVVASVTVAVVVGTIPIVLFIYLLLLDRI